MCRGNVFRTCNSKVHFTFKSPGESESTSTKSVICNQSMRLQEPPKKT